MPTTAKSIAPAAPLQWAPTAPRVGRRAVSYYGRWPSPTQGRSILLRAKELLPVVAFLEACAALQLIQEYREQPGLLTRAAGGTCTHYRPDFSFQHGTQIYLVFAGVRATQHAASLESKLFAHCGMDTCHFQVCCFPSEKQHTLVLRELSPVQFRRGEFSARQRRAVTALFDELIRAR